MTRSLTGAASAGAGDPAAGITFGESPEQITIARETPLGTNRRGRCSYPFRSRKSQDGSMQSANKNQDNAQTETKK